MVRDTGGWDGPSWRSSWPGQITRADPGHHRPLFPPSQTIPCIFIPIRGSLKYLWFKVMSGGLIDLRVYRRLRLCHAFVVRRLTLFSSLRQCLKTGRWIQPPASGSSEVMLKSEILSESDKHSLLCWRCRNSASRSRISWKAHVRSNGQSAWRWLRVYVMNGILKPHEIPCILIRNDWV